MKLRWYHHGNLKVSSDVYYRIGIQNGEKLFLLGYKKRVPDQESSSYDLMVSELDLETMKINELMLIEKFDLEEDCVFTYSDNIIIFEARFNSPYIKIAKINVRTHQMEKMTINHGFNDRDILSTCIVEDSIYFICRGPSPFLFLLILTVNLKTWRNEWINRPNAPKCWVRYISKAFSHGKNILFILFDELTISIFNTEIKEWTKAKDHFDNFDPKYYLRMVYDSKLYINGEVFNFRFSSHPSLDQSLDIFNCTSMEWRTKTVSIPSVCHVINSSNRFSFKDKIFFINNSKNTINKLLPSCIQKESMEALPNSDLMDIYELDLNPSLQQLCIMNLIEQRLPLNKIPKHLLSEFMNYIV